MQDKGQVSESLAVGLFFFLTNIIIYNCNYRFSTGFRLRESRIFLLLQSKRKVEGQVYMGFHFHVSVEIGDLN